MAITFKKGKRIHDPLYIKLRSVLRGVRTRCNSTTSKHYKSYGALGVTICKEWGTINGFINSVDKVDGWDEELFLQGELHLDKDLKIKGNKVYSPETCMFVKREVNTKFRPNASRDITGLSPDNELHEFSNYSEFGKIHGLDKGNISTCLREGTSIKGWFFVYKHSGKDIFEVKRMRVDKLNKYEGESPEGRLYYFSNQREFAEEHGLKSWGIGECLSGKKRSYKGWTFKRKDTNQ